MTSSAVLSGAKLPALKWTGHTAQASLILMSLLAIDASANPEENANAQTEPTIESIVVTGTRLKTPNQQSASPILTLDSTAFSYSGKTSVQEIVIEVGALAGSQGNDEINNGESYLNLRNLGTNRTLTLVDGQRFVSGSSGGVTAVDTNSIPMAMIDRVEVLTGGASAIYGADAVTGVVNFILKDDFSGVAVDAQYGDAFDGDFGDQQYSLTLGNNFADDRANVTLSYTYGNRPAVLASARAQASTDLYERINNPNGDVPQYVLANGTNEAFFTHGGAHIDPFGAFSNGFNGDGTPFVHGTNIGSFAGTGEIGGDGAPNYLLFSNGIRSANERHIVTIKSHYDVSDSFQPYLNVNYSDVSTRSNNQQSLTVGGVVNRDNPFLPASVLAAAGPDVQSIDINRWDFDAGFNQRDTDKQTYRIVLGAKGDLSDNTSYDISANYGQSERNQTVNNNRFYDRYVAAIDTTFDDNGNIVCRSNLDPASYNSLSGDFLSTGFDASQGPQTFTAGADSGCVAYNPFTTDNSVNQAAIDWIWQPTTNQVKNSQKVFSAYIASDSANYYTLAGGPIAMIVGGEYREEETAGKFDQLSSAAQSVAYFTGSDLSGQFDVAELFGELSLPLLKSLTVDAAFRFSDYSTIGKTNTWKLGSIWQPIEQLSLRATLSSAVRAPNLGELFTPQTSISTALGEDPCHIDNINSGSSTRAANCAQALNALGVDPATFKPLLGTFFPGLSGGSPDLKEEISKTHTIGFIYQPTWAEGLTIGLDRFDITITDAVVRPRQKAIFDACYDAPSLDNVFCSLIGRDSNTGAANFVELQSVNVARIETSGYELNTQYRYVSGDLGVFALSLNATYLDELMMQKTTEPAMTDDKGLFDTDTGGSSPEWVANMSLNWQFDDWDVNYRFNYQSSTLRSPLINEQRTEAHDIIDQPFVKAFINHDIQAGYFYDDRIRLYVGIRNLSDEYPDKTYASLNGSSGRQGYAGRTFYMGMNMQFDAW